VLLQKAGKGKRKMQRLLRVSPFLEADLAVSSPHTSVAELISFATMTRLLVLAALAQAAIALNVSPMLTTSRPDAVVSRGAIFDVE